jgi:uncharacterized protein (TIGR03435 family)
MPKALFCLTCRKFVLAALALLTLASVQAQVTDQSPPPQFEVVVIKKTPPETTNWKQEFNPGLMNIQNRSVFQMVKYAYDLKSDTQLLNLPAWASTEFFDIQGKEDEELIQRLSHAPTPQYRALQRQLVRGILKERFHLGVHETSVERPIYALVVAPGGAKVKPYMPDDGRTFHGQLGPDGKVDARGVSMQFLADRISSLPEAGGRVVVDRTGMAGEYDWSLRWTPENLSAAPPVAGDPTGGESAPSLFTALEEQLGLKLVRQKGTIPALVVDRVERPTDN